MIRSRIARSLSHIGLVFGVILAAGCGGGGASGGAGTVPNASGALAPVNTPQGTATFQITVPPATTAATTAAASAARAPKYISPSSQSLAILTDGANPVNVDLTASSPSCKAGIAGALTCTASASATVGKHVFTLTLYDQTGSHGNVLSTNSTVPTQVLAANNPVIPITLDGVVAIVKLALANTSVTAGSPQTIALTAQLEDADGNMIIGDAPFSNPVALTTTDSTNGPLSKKTLNSPADANGITVAYNGAKITSIVYSATANGLMPSNVTNAVLVSSAARNGGGANALGCYTTSTGTTFCFVPSPDGIAAVQVATASGLEPTSARVPTGQRSKQSTLTPLVVPLTLGQYPANACTVRSSRRHSLVLLVQFIADRGARSHAAARGAADQDHLQHGRHRRLRQQLGLLRHLRCRMGRSG